MSSSFALSPYLSTSPGGQAPPPGQTQAQAQALAPTKTKKFTPKNIALGVFVLLCVIGLIWVLWHFLSKRSPAGAAGAASGTGATGATGTTGTTSAMGTPGTLPSMPQVPVAPIVPVAPVLPASQGPQAPQAPQAPIYSPLNMPVNSPGLQADLPSILTYLMKRGKALDNTPWSPDEWLILKDETDWIPLYTGNTPVFYYPKGIETTQSYEIYYDIGAKAWNVRPVSGSSEPWGLGGGYGNRNHGANHGASCGVSVGKSGHLEEGEIVTSKKKVYQIIIHHHHHYR